MSLFDFFKPRSTPAAPATSAQLEAARKAMFPGGEPQIAAESAAIQQIAGGSLTFDDAKRILLRAKGLLFISQDKSASRIVPSIVNAANSKLSHFDASRIYHYLSELTQARFAGGTGTSVEDAVIILATSSVVGIDEEYNWLNDRFGKEGVGWKTETRMHGETDDGRMFETFHIRLADGTRKQVVFDISAFYGKF
jgi:hypothetical protein